MGILHYVYMLFPHSLRIWGNEQKAKWIIKHRGRGGAAEVAPISIVGGGRGFMEDGGKFLRGDGHLEAKVKRVNGEVEYKDLGHNTVVDAGCDAFADDWYDGSDEITSFNYHAMGTGGSPPSQPAVTVTALATEVESRTSGTKSKPASKQFRTVGTIAATAARSINEWGLLNASSSGILFCTRWFTAIALATGDSIEFTYTFTFNSFTS